MRHLLSILLLSLLVFAGFSPAFSEEQPMSLETFVAQAKENTRKNRRAYPEPWIYFRDFDKVISKLSPEERKAYEYMQQARDIVKPMPEYTKALETYDLRAFKRAYPHLAPAFNHSSIKRQFRSHFHMTYSYGWKRYFAWANRRLALRVAREKAIKLKPVFIGLSSPRLKNHTVENPDAQGFFAVSMYWFVQFCLCHDYKPAVMDLMRMARVEGKLKLSAPLSYMLMLRAREKNIRLVYEDKWQAEIDAELSADEKKKYQDLMVSKDKFKKELLFCS